MDRRNFLLTSSGAAIGSLAVPGLAAEDENSGYADSGLITGTPKPLRYQQIPGFLSADQISPHHAAHYGGALRAFNGVESKLDGHLAGTATVDDQALQRM